MKKNMNVIQIRGIKGIIMAVLIAICLAVGFIAFPGWVCMNIWNFTSAHINNLPSIGIIQGVLLWGIIIASYFVIKKDSVVVCFKAPEGLSEDELKDVFSDLKRASVEESIIKAMIKAREAELKNKSENTEAVSEEKVTDSDIKG